MAIVSSWGFTNATAASHDVTPVLIDTAAKYAVTTDAPGKCVIKNITSPIDQVEVITYQAQDIDRVSQSENNAHPPMVKAGRSINVKLEAKKRLTSTTDDTFVQDLPVSVGITFKFVKNSEVNSADLLTLLSRAIGALFDSDDSGNSRIDNMMLMQLNPNN